MDIVDDDDVVIGRGTRQSVHRDECLHRSAHIILNDSQGRFMVQKRSHRKDTGAGLWDSSAAGHVNSGESYVECAVRELREELGVEVAAEDLREIGRLRPEERNGYEFTRVFRIQCDQPLTLQAEEIDDGCWLSSASLKQWLRCQPDCFTPAFHAIWPMVEKSLRSDEP